MALTICLVIAGLVTTAESLLRADSGRRQALAATELLAQMRTQEVALRDYRDSGSPQSLGLYTSARAGTDRALRGLEQAAVGSRAGQVSVVVVAARRWQVWAEDQRQRIAAGERAPGAALPAEGDRLFDAFTVARATLIADLDSDASTSGSAIYPPAALALTALVAGALVPPCLAILLGRRVLRVYMTPLRDLAVAAARIAEGGEAQIAYGGRADQIGQLSRALRAWHDASAERQALVDDAPVGIMRTDSNGVITGANPACLAMHGCTEPGQMIGRLFLDFIHPADHNPDPEHYRRLATGGLSRYVIENRHVRLDGVVVWCSVTVNPVRGAGGRPAGFISVLEDITVRKAQLGRAAEIQRELLPQPTLRLDGYELAAACLPAQDVAGDMFDWALSAEGQLDVTVADVMGKGIGAALVMAIMRTALRAASPDLPPGARVRLADQSMVGTDWGLFVTLFHARLDPRSGVLRYVDAGHGHCAIWRANGELFRLPVRSLPVGVRLGAEFREGDAVLEPGDVLLVHSDGLIETRERTVDLAELAGCLADAADAADMVRRLLATTPFRPADDVTILVVRRLPEAASAARRTA